MREIVLQIAVKKTKKTQQRQVDDTHDVKGESSSYDFGYFYLFHAVKKQNNEALRTFECIIKTTCMYIIHILIKSDVINLLIIRI
jgi:hypothetical protein